MLLGSNSERSDVFDRPQLDIGRFVIGEVAKDIVISTWSIFGLYLIVGYPRS